LDLPGHIGENLSTRYDLQRELGRGGMATVYLARDRKHDRPVAVKVLHPDFAASLGAERFVREIRLTARLNHPHILPLLDSDQADGIPYYVMPFVDGESLRDRLDRERSIPLPDALRVAREVASALSYAHAQAVIHRDIKPENILLSAGHAVVADFGIARALSAASDDSVTQAGIAIGTPAYMSPEQSVGDPVDGRTDVYALGTVLFEMLTGETPFRAPSTVALLARKITGVAPRVGALREVPIFVENAVERALARDPDERYPTVDTFVQALDESAALAPREIEAPPNAVAVLPFVSMSPDASDEFLGEGISEELIHALSRLPELRVVARTSAFAFKQAKLDIRAIGEKLKVRRIIEGSVRRAGTRLRVTAQLVDASNAFELWSERYDRDAADLFAVQDEISAAIAGALKAVLAPTGTRLPTQFPARARPSLDVAAYEEYLRGRHYWSMRTPNGFRQSVEHLARAIDMAPQFWPAHAALAETYATMAIYGAAPPMELLAGARASADRALAGEPTASAEAYTATAAVAIVADREWNSAERAFERAIAADPQYPTAPQWLASLCLVPQGRFEEGRQALRRARELDPLSLTIASSIAALEYYARDVDAAIEASRNVLRLDERFAIGHYFLGLALEQRGDLVAATATLDRALELSPSAEISAARAAVYACAGELQEARSIAARLQADAADRYVSPVLLAQIAVVLGDHEGAFAHLDAAQALHAAELIWLPVRPWFDPLRGDPRFAQHLRALRLGPGR
jgi:serine/threonine-protein kinase